MMSQQLDWIGGGVVAKRAREVANQRPSTAERKAELCLQIKSLALKVPGTVTGGSVQTVRAWRAAQEKAMKVAGSSRSSVVELELVVKSLEAFAAVPA